MRTALDLTYRMAGLGPGPRPAPEQGERSEIARGGAPRRWTPRRRTHRIGVESETEITQGVRNRTCGPLGGNCVHARLQEGYD
jgi:hypothetical protein